MIQSIENREFEKQREAEGGHKRRGSLTGGSANNSPTLQGAPSQSKFAPPSNFKQGGGSGAHQGKEQGNKWEREVPCIE